MIMRSVVPGRQVVG